MQSHFSDGMLWARLGPRLNIAEQLRRWGTLLGCTTAEMADVEDETGWAKLLRSTIGLRRMLLVIDDAWRSEDALAFKVGGPHCAYLMTTRIPSVALDFASNGTTLVQELNEDDGLKLLARFVPGIVANERCTARTLVQSVGGLPLALTLMGKYLKSQTHSSQPRRQRAALERLSHPEERLRLTIVQAPLEQHTSLPAEMPLSLDAVIGVSAWQLDEATQRTLLLLSVFPAKPYSFSEEAALAVSGASEKTRRPGRCRLPGEYRMWSLYAPALPLPTLPVQGCMRPLLMNAWLSILPTTWRCVRTTMMPSHKKQAMYSPLSS